MKKIRTTVAVIAAVGTLVLALSACQGQTEPTSQEEYDSNASVVTSSSESEDSPALDETISLEPFKHINISVMATSIRLEVGDSYRVGYHRQCNEYHLIQTLYTLLFSINQLCSLQSSSGFIILHLNVKVQKIFIPKIRKFFSRLTAHGKRKKECC